MKLIKTIPFLLLGLMVFSVQANTIAADSRSSVRKEMSRPQFRGGIVFKNYCILCHGERGDGIARATKLYGVVNLVIKENTPAYYDNVIRHGGKAVGKSDLMPPWNDELSEEQIQDVVAYLDSVRDPVKRGEAVFKTNCILCHGIKGNGKGRAAVLYNPPPADLTHSNKNDEYKISIITLGGAAMGRSAVMPIWGKQLSTQEISDVVDYLRTILVK
ncbi:MAG: c-type cytochrome [Gammaproteobacteria bacterium]|nr:c-type cytochrome [Gammaproteobacteria bacterium]